MHKYFVIILTLLFSVSCQSTENTAEEIERVNSTVFRFFDAIKTFDYDLLRETCTTDFILAENGVKMSVEDFIEYIKPMASSLASIEYRFEDIETRVEGNVAWTSLTNHGLMKTKDEKEVKFEWLESAVLKKQAGNWKIDLYHSTVVEQVGEF